MTVATPVAEQFFPEFCQNLSKGYKLKVSNSGNPRRKGSNIVTDNPMVQVKTPNPSASIGNRVKRIFLGKEVIIINGIDFRS